MIQSSFSPNDEKILFGCSDNTIVILDTKTKSVETVQANIRPVFLSWHPLNHFFIVTSRCGVAEIFDVGLSQLEFVPIRKSVFFEKIQESEFWKMFEKMTLFFPNFNPFLFFKMALCICIIKRKCGI